MVKTPMPNTALITERGTPKTDAEILEQGIGELIASQNSILLEITGTEQGSSTIPNCTIAWYPETPISAKNAPRISKTIALKLVMMDRIERQKIDNIKYLCQRQSLQG